MIKYIKAAFWNRWNLLTLLAGTGVAVISGRPDIVGALLLAGEVAYLGMLGAHPKFQKYVEAQAHKTKQERTGESKQELLRRLTHSLPRGLRDRYDGLRQRCLDLHEIATNLRRTSDDRFILHAADRTSPAPLQRTLRRRVAGPARPEPLAHC